MNNVAIVDYGLCNLDSVRRAVEECGANPTVTADPADLRVADRVILPGVGSFDVAMEHLRSSGMADELDQQVRGEQIPFLGICLGMQLMMNVGTEGGETKGLGWVSGTVELLVPTDDDPRVPHVGWNDVEPTTAGSELFDGIDHGSDFYFVHSYCVRCDEPSEVAALTPYTGGFASAVRSGSAYGVQFHPEKSQTVGFALLRNFLEI